MQGRKKSKPSSSESAKSLGGSPIERLYEEYAAHKRHELALREEIDALQCTPEDLKRLRDIAHNLIKEFISDVLRRRELNVKIIEGRGLDNIDFLFKLVADGLLLHYSLHGKSQSDAWKSLESDLEQFLGLWNTLVKARANIPKIFYTLLMSEGIIEQQLWEWHRKKYDLVVAKAKAFKKRCVSNRNRIRKMTELRPGLLEEAEYGYERILQNLDKLINEKELQEMKRKYRRPGGKVRKNSRIWTPILKRLETELRGCFETKKHWEIPGGFRGDAIPAEVYEAINKLLHMFYPLYWDFDPNATQSIKVRCQKIDD
jgi:hypothetical protein